MPLSGPNGRINGNASFKESAECRFVCDTSTGASSSVGSSARLSVSCNSTSSSSWTTPLELRSPSSSACQIHFSHDSFFVPRLAISSVMPESIKRSSARKVAAAVRHFQSQAVVTIEQEPVVSRDARESLQVGNDHDRKLEALRLVDRH